MPLNEKAALGGAANLETSSQGSLDNPPINPAQQIPQVISTQGQARGAAAVWGCRSPGCLYLPAPIPHASPWAILLTFGTRARSAYMPLESAGAAAALGSREIQQPGWLW